MLQEIDSVLLHLRQHLGAATLLTCCLGVYQTLLTRKVGFELLLTLYKLLVIVGSLHHVVQLQEFAICHSLIIYKVFYFFLGCAAYIVEHLVERLTGATILATKTMKMGFELVELLDVLLKIGC